MQPLLKRLLAVAFALGFAGMQALPALACGSLVAPDGDVRLSRAATLVAYHDGIEHYMTTFSYQGNEKNVGWIVPLPAIPLKIEDGGAWTFQRLNREVNPQPQNFAFGSANEAATASATVVEQTQVEALNITVIKGSGSEIVDWVTNNGFALTGDVRSHLLTYARGTSIFMAAKYDTSAAQARHQLVGDGVPLLLTMKLEHPWVPIEVLALDGQQVNADIYFLTDQSLNTSDFNAAIGQSPVGSEVPGAPGMKIAFQEQVNGQLYKDLSSDRNMGWVWPGSWLTYLHLQANEPQVTYDLGVSSNGIFRIAPFGTKPMDVVDKSAQQDYPGWIPKFPLNTPEIVLALAVMIAAGVTTFFVVQRMSRPKVAQTAQAE